MVDIVVGSAPHLRLMEAMRPGNTTQPITVEGRMLALRKPRRGPRVLEAGAEERRTKRAFQDPVKAQVMTVMIEDGSGLPADINPDEYRIVVRLVPKNTP